MAEGMLVVWTDVAPAGEDDFEEWYNREHVNERAAIKGFLSGHRYAAIRGRPRYLALYETRTPQVLSSKHYREVSEAPTGWTKRVTRQFQNTTRGIFQVRAREGEGRGGVVASLRRVRTDPLLRPASISTIWTRLTPLERARSACVRLRNSRHTRSGGSPSRSRSTTFAGMSSSSPVAIRASTASAA